MGRTKSSSKSWQHQTGPRGAMDYGASRFPFLDGESSHSAEWWGCGWQITCPFSSQVLVLRGLCSQGHTLEITPRNHTHPHVPSVPDEDGKTST